MSALDTIFNIFKSAHPEASDEDIKSYIEDAKASPDQMAAAASPFDVGSTGTAHIPLSAPNSPSPEAQPTDPTPQPAQPDLTMSKAPDMSLNIPDANSVKSNFDVNTSDNTATQNGSAPSVTAQPGQVPPSVPPTPDAPPVTTPVSPGASSPSAQTADSADKAPVDKDAALKAALAPQKQDTSDADFAAQEKRKKAWGSIPVAISGIGDALGNAAKAVGGSANTNAAQLAQERLDTGLVNDKKAFEDKQRKDPNSDVSQHYQKVLNLMLGDHAKTMDVSKMSAEQIAATLPTVEKYMQKELGMAQIKSNKDMTTSMQNRNEQDKLYQQGLANLNSVRGDSQLQKIEAQRDAASAAYNRLDELKKSGTTPNPVDYADILGQIYKARTGAAPTNEIMKEIHQDTLAGKANKWYTFATGHQAPATTSDIANSLQSMALSMGNQADKLHEGYMQSRTGDALSPRLNPEDRDRLSKLSRGMSFKEATAASMNPQPMASKPHPQDQEALDWAKTHTNDPRAAKILRANGL